MIISTSSLVTRIAYTRAPDGKAAARDLRPPPGPDAYCARCVTWPGPKPLPSCRVGEGAGSCGAATARERRGGRARRRRALANALATTAGRSDRTPVLDPRVR